MHAMTINALVQDSSQLPAGPDTSELARCCSKATP